ncbi:MAG: alpha/beta hydrolase [Desulfobacteraceae bacterium]|nr:alpha/beta hydrolase [Desulfobacteraceae bacterium]
MAVHYSNRDLHSTNVRMRSLKIKGTSLIIRGLWRCMPARMERWVADKFFTPAGHAMTPGERRWLNKAENFQITVNGHEIRCRKWGTGPGILFSHGWNGRGANFHAFFPPLIKAGFSVICFDAPGHGDSGGRLSNYFEFSDTVRALLTNADLNIKGAIGHSVGAAALVNGLEKENLRIPAVLLAPAIDLKGILVTTFNRFGIPVTILMRIIKRLEDRLGYSLTDDNPARLIEKFDTEMVVVHDRRDRVIPFDAVEPHLRPHRHIRLHVTEGLGHKRILFDDGVIALVVTHLKLQLMSKYGMNEKRAAMA